MMKQYLPSKRDPVLPLVPQKLLCYGLFWKGFISRNVISITCAMISSFYLFISSSTDYINLFYYNHNSGLPCALKTVFFPVIWEYFFLHNHRWYYSSDWTLRSILFQFWDLSTPLRILTIFLGKFVVKYKLVSPTAAELMCANIDRMIGLVSPNPPHSDVGQRVTRGVVEPQHWIRGRCTRCNVSLTPSMLSHNPVPFSLYSPSFLNVA